ncbi:MAG: hypothetical protein A2275_14270 [Bacteroidetes bacterium RIFOXYA12_FULL_35_11]|nr:MAG: hypothetical protein A2275_14270 [Bacteroidetes bacterium RIFOXYA12_FULL_35_11]OFY95168.1 MAG: hypothetical protein A2309_05330 [Bacteroidetes bacterium RIFOXYB2_FULL_35_7]
MRNFSSSFSLSNKNTEQASSSVKIFFSLEHEKIKTVNVNNATINIVVEYLKKILYVLNSISASPIFLEFTSILQNKSDYLTKPDKFQTKLIILEHQVFFYAFFM